MVKNLNATNERRKRALDALLAPDEGRDSVLRKFVHLANQALGIPGSFISVLDEEFQYIRASHNFSLKHSKRDESLCQHVVNDDNALIVPDTWLDARFLTHRFVTGEPYIRFYAGVPLKDREGHVLGTFCVTDREPHPFSDMQLATLQQLAELVMSFLEAWHATGFNDPVTLLPNRSRLISDMQSLAAEGDKVKRRLIIIDCLKMAHAYDLAKTVGMVPVEELLRDIAIKLPRRIRPQNGEMFYALSTGRFAILVRDESRLDASWIAGRMEGICAELGNGISITLTSHAGQTDFTAISSKACDVVRRASAALEEAIDKNLPSVMYKESEEIKHSNDFTLMNELSDAIRFDKGLYLVYQPKTCLTSGQPVGLEALIRWTHPVRGELSPAAFVPMAEQTDLLHEMTEWVIDKTIACLKRFNRQNIQLPITINVSLNDFAKNNFADLLESKMLEARLSNNLLGIECLETERIIENAQALTGLHRLYEKGFTISLDDFGTGYSNISYLRRMPLDIIKLDRSLISGVLEDTSSLIIARSIIRMLKELNYTVLAEGVEDAEVAILLRDFGCDQAQGYFFSKPLSDPELDIWLQRRLKN
ncbi:EAL domain-containing protein [Pantoea sp. EABMAA-21]|uniref:GGDEF domain-containing phosphodiesterase n=1 Tax=Pantoea sp. EABMAA-21 TaxID=3043302 RepID=UPI0024B51DE1|nr:GGDEF domain-containing phosphodiesterase [Pantoea sp. EABMAA-21]MDI9275857.1 EAL domain-containing protein [Pantoea sp. EABMAA-21]